MEGHRGSPYFILLLFVVAVRLALTEGVPSQVTGLSLFKAVYSEAPAMRVTWTTPPSNVTISQYQVQYRISGTTTWGREFIVTGSPPLTTAVITGLNVGTEYHVRVRAESAVGAGIWSDAQSERTYMVPSQVTGMAVSKAVHSNRPALRVTWIPPQSDVVITLCQVQYRRVGTSWGAVSRVTSGSITSTVLQALSVGTAYQVRIRAVSVIGNGSWSSVESVTTFMRAPHPDPRSVHAVAVNRSGIIQVSWSAPTVPSGELHITGYSIQYKVQKRDFYRYKSVTSNSVETMINGLLSGTAYQVYVAGVNAIGRGPYCCEGTPVVVRTYNVPSQVTGLIVSKALHLANPALRVTWTPPQSDEAISHYRMQYRRETSWRALNPAASGSTTSTVLEALDAGTAYQVRIRAVSAIGNGMWSTVESETTYIRAPHPDPRSVRAVAVNRSGVIKVSWSTPTVPSGELPITGYSIQYKFGSATENVKEIMSQSSPTEVTGLLPGTEYQVFVASVNALGTGVYCCKTSAIYVRMPKATPQPTVSLVSSTLHSVSICWSVASPQDVTSYHVFWWTESTEIGRSVALLNDTKFVIEDLHSNTAYHVVVMAGSPLGSVNSTNEALFTLPNIVQGSLSVIVLPNHILQVSWEPADDAERALINYIVNTTTADMKYNNSTLVKHPITSVSITGLPQYSAGTVSVWAKNSGALSERVISTFRMVNIVTNVTGVSAGWVDEGFTSLRATLPERGTYRISYSAVNKENALEPRVFTTASSSQVVKGFSPEYFYTILVEAENDCVFQAPTAGEESIAAVQGSNVVTVGSFLGGLVTGIVCSLLVMGIVLGVAKLRKEGKSTKSAREEENKNENTYDIVGPKEASAQSDHVAMEANPAYGSVH